MIIRQYTAFPFNTLKVSEVNLFADAISVLVPFLLWVGSTGLSTTLMEGKGTVKEIYIMSAYALTPIIIVNIPATIVSHMHLKRRVSLILARLSR